MELQGETRNHYYYWCYWYGIGFAIHRCRNRVLVGHHRVVALGNYLHLCAFVTKQ